MEQSAFLDKAKQAEMRHVCMGTFLDMCGMPFGRDGMAGKTLILAGGAIDLAFAKEFLETQDFDTVVCADSGMDAAVKLGLPVHYAMGDFDSVSEEALGHCQKAAEGGIKTKFVQYPAQKDATDSHIVLDWVTERDPSEIVILGATGKRMDHFLANLNILMKPLACGIPACLIDQYNKIYLLDHGQTIHRNELFGKYISFLPLTEKVSAVRLQGFAYELDGQDMVIGDSLGVSNEMGEGQDDGVVEFQDGILIVVESKD